WSRFGTCQTILHLFCIQRRRRIELRHRRCGCLSSRWLNRPIFPPVFLKGQNMLPDKYRVAIFQSATVDSSVVYVSPVKGIVVLDYELIVVPIDLRVMTGYGEVVDLDDVVWKSTDGGHSLSEWDLLQNCLLKLQEEFCHDCPPPSRKLRNLWYQGCSTTRNSRHVILSSPPLSLAALIKSSHAASSEGEFSRISLIKSSLTSFVRPSVASRYMSSRSAINSWMSGSTASSEPKARMMMFCISDFSASSIVIKPRRSCSMTREWSCVSCSRTPFRKRYMRLSPAWAMV